MNDDAKFDANLKFVDKETRKKFTTHIGSQDVNATDEIADDEIMCKLLSQKICSSC